MRTALLTTALTVLAAAPALAQEEGGSVNLLEPHGGLMFWTLIIFAILLFLLSRYAFKPLTEAVAAREAALEAAIEGAKRDRDEAARLLEQQRAAIAAAHGDAQALIAEGRTIGEKLRAQMLEETREQQQALIERAKSDIEAEKVRAIAQLRAEAVDLAIAGASKVIERNLDDQTNRQLVDGFLGTIGAGMAKR